MPGEIRYLMFSGAELCEAIEKYGCRTLPHFPAGAVIKGEVIGDDDPDVVVNIRNGELLVHHIRSHDLLKVMIRFCRDLHVPLPARGIKRMRCINGMLACEVAIENRNRRTPQPTLTSHKRSIPEQIRFIRAPRPAH